MNTPINAEVNELAADIEKIVPNDDLGPQSDDAWDRLSDDTQQAVADKVALAVADKLERDGHPQAAEYLRQAQDMEDFFASLFGDDDDQS